MLREGLKYLDILLLKLSCGMKVNNMVEIVNISINNKWLD